MLVFDVQYNDSVVLYIVKQSAQYIYHTYVTIYGYKNALLVMRTFTQMSSFHCLLLNLFPLPKLRILVYSLYKLFPYITCAAFSAICTYKLISHYIHIL